MAIPSVSPLVNGHAQSTEKNTVAARAHVITHNHAVLAMANSASTHSLKNILVTSKNTPQKTSFLLKGYKIS